MNSAPYSDRQLDSERQVVVTGLGVISPIGRNTEEFWEALAAGRSGISSFPLNGNPEACAGEIGDFSGRIQDIGDLEEKLRKAVRKALKVMSRETQLGVAAAQQAFADSRLADDEPDRSRIGVCFGAGYVAMMPEDFLSGVNACKDEQDSFEFDRWGTQGIPQIEPLWLLKCLPNMAACYAAIFNELRGPNNSITQGEAAANLAVAEARRIIQDGEADAMVVGGTGNNILPCSLMHTMMDQDVAPGGPEPATVCRPFDRGRTGSVAGEGAAALILEERSAAIRRGARIYAEILGAGSSCVVNQSRVPDGAQALVNAMQATLRSAAVSPEAIGHVHAHGLSSHRCDIDEAVAIRRVFGDRANTLPVVAAKSNVGNSGAGGGAIELVASILAMDRGHLFPVLNYEEPDPECPLAPVTSSDVDAGGSFLNLSVSPQGQASCVAMRSAA